MRAPVRVLPLLAITVGVGAIAGGAALIGVGGWAGLLFGAILIVLGALTAVFGLLSKDVSHPLYITKKGQISHSFSHRADEAYQDPEDNRKELQKIYGVLKDAAAAYYGHPMQTDDASATASIEKIVKADSAGKIEAYIEAKVDERGNEVATPGPHDRSYGDIVREQEVTRPGRWDDCAIDASVNDKPVYPTQKCLSP
jgi:hypothetical protein